MWVAVSALTMLVMSAVIASSYSWLIAWLCMEGLLMLMVVPMIGGPASNESAMKYFLIQALGATGFLFSMLSPLNLTTLVLFSLLMKMGLFPFHFWVSHVYAGVSIWVIVILSTVMKIPGLILISHWKEGHLWPVFVGGVLISSIAGVYTSNLKKLMAWSSVNHGSWLLILTCSTSVWVCYLSVYSLILSSVALCLTANHSKSVYTTASAQPINSTLVVCVSMLSLSGMPPLLGFSIKWMALVQIMSVSGWMGLAVLSLVSITLFFYMQTLFYSLSQPLLTSSPGVGGPLIIMFTTMNLSGLLLALSFL